METIISEIFGVPYRNKQDRVKSNAKLRRERKEMLVREAGGQCVRCGYSRCLRALQFHHLNPEDKLFTLSDKGRTLSLASQREEIAKCILLCANCHMEVESERERETVSSLGS